MRFMGVVSRRTFLSGLAVCGGTGVTCLTLPKRGMAFDSAPGLARRRQTASVAKKSLPSFPSSVEPWPRSNAEAAGSRPPKTSRVPRLFASCWDTRGPATRISRHCWNFRPSRRWSSPAARH